MSRDISICIGRKKTRRKPKLSIENILLLFLSYYRNYNTFLVLGLQFGLNESNTYRWINKNHLFLFIHLFFYILFYLKYHSYINNLLYLHIFLYLYLQICLLLYH
ncbi:MAG: transposase family protein [Bacilli bacterium]|nr:transposase family protein [Bacilli bacterium]